MIIVGMFDKCGGQDRMSIPSAYHDVLFDIEHSTKRSEVRMSDQSGCDRHASPICERH